MLRWKIKFDGWHQIDEIDAAPNRCQIEEIEESRTEGAVVCLAQGGVLRVLRAIPLPWDRLREATRFPLPASMVAKPPCSLGAGR